MARLNENPVSLDSLESLRKKLLRQNRDLAKSNNIRALRIRQLENECACMLSENLELRGRILELEKQVEDNDARRIADHALAVKLKLESQLTEWATLLSSLGLEPPSKRHSPRIQRPLKQRMSFTPNRPSPSQRRLRDVARDIDELGHIAEAKSCSRKSMNPEQILALRSEFDSASSPSPSSPSAPAQTEDDAADSQSPPHSPLQPQGRSPVCLPSPEPGEEEANERLQPAPSPKKPPPPVAEPVSRPPLQPRLSVPAKVADPQPIKIGAKRKFTARDEAENAPLQRPATEEQSLPAVVGKPPSVREKAVALVPQTLSGSKSKSATDEATVGRNRKPLAMKSTNDDISSPKKISSSTPIEDELAAAKAISSKPRTTAGRVKPKSKSSPPVPLGPPPPSTLPKSLSEPVLLSPGSPRLMPGGAGATGGGHRGDTPPPADIPHREEPSRPSRRNRAAISYAEPNLRDKMRRPTKELYDAVTGEGKYSRRSSQAELVTPEMIEMKHEPDVEQSWKSLIVANPLSLKAKPTASDTSTASGKMPPLQDLPPTVVTDRRRRPSAAGPKVTGLVDRDSGAPESSTNADTKAVNSVSISADIYEFISTSPQHNKGEAAEPKRPTRRQSATTRRLSAAVETDRGAVLRDGPGPRRRSAMVQATAKGRLVD